mgnify:FL=1|tara:strand:+ start:484 stop:1596 length:1113 start_codon:yes stop_codon:yes gene_type:complete
MKKILLILIILPFCTFAQVDTTQITLKPNWFETNVVQGLEIYFAGTYGRPNDFSDQSLLDDYGFTIGFKKKASELCITCPKNEFGRKDDELKADEDKESYAFNKQGLEYRITWSYFRDDNKPFREDRQSARYTKLFKKWGVWAEVDHRNTVFDDVTESGSNQEYVKGGVRLLFRATDWLNITGGINARTNPFVSYTNEFINWYEGASWDTESSAQNVFYDFNNDGTWEDSELVGTYTEVLDPVLNEPYITNVYNAKKEIWVASASPVIGLDFLTESRVYFFNLFVNVYPYPYDVVRPEIEYAYSGNDVELKAFGMEADWAPTESITEFDAGVVIGLKIGKGFSAELNGEISNYYGVYNYRTQIGLKYKIK